MVAVTRYASAESAPRTPGRTALTLGRFGDIEIVPMRGALGADVRGVELRRLDNRTFRLLYLAYLDHLVLRFRDQMLAPQDLVALARRWGEIEMPPSPAERSGHHHYDGPPEITVVSNVKESGVPIGELGDGEVMWHSDYSFKEIPASMRVLYATELPPPDRGATTHFLNTYAAFDSLPTELGQRILGRTIKHDTAYDSTMNLRGGARTVTDVRASPGPVHPIVSTHVETGHNALFLGRRPMHSVTGLAPEASDALLDELWEHTVQERHVIEHEWRVNDVILWDNRCTLHRRGAFDSRARRVLLAAQCKGQRPVEAADAASRMPHPRAALTNP